MGSGPEKGLGKEIGRELRKEIGRELRKEIGRELGKELGKEIGRELGKKLRGELEEKVEKKLKEKVGKELEEKVGKELEEKVEKKLKEKVGKELEEKVGKELEEKLRNRLGRAPGDRLGNKGLENRLGNVLFLPLVCTLVVFSVRGLVTLRRRPVAALWASSESFGKQRAYGESRTGGSDRKISVSSASWSFCGGVRGRIIALLPFALGSKTSFPRVD